MSKLQVNEIVDKEGTGSPTFTNGVVVSGVGTFSSQVSIAGTLTYEDVTNIDAVGVVTARVGMKVLAGGIDAVGVVTATSFSGNGSALTGVAATDNIDTNTIRVSGISTFTEVVNASSDVRVTGNLNAGITTTSSIINGTALSHRNIIINGAMEVAQRGTSDGSVTSSGYYACDRWRVGAGGLDSALTVARSSLSSSDTPYSSGFRYATKITNGDQSGGLGATDFISFAQRVEGQNINSCGWDFTSTSSNLTVSFWIKSSVAQTFYSRFRVTEASANKEYVFAVAATTSWQKITQTIPGASGLNPKNDEDMGFFWDIILAYGTDYTGSMTLDQWNTVNTSAYTPDMTTTWYTTDNATFEITGVQLEVGPVATPFEFRSIGDELARCQRYYYRHATGNTKGISENATMYNSSSVFLSIPLPTEMRDQPTLEITNSTSHFLKYENNGGTNFDTLGRDGVTTARLLCINGSVSGTAGNACMIRTNSASAYVAALAEL